MRILITFCLSLFVCVDIHAQTTIYSQTFETSYSDWTLTSTDLAGVSTPNYWTVNNTYPGNAIAPTVTPDQPTGAGGITGAPESFYMHIRSNVGPANATFNASGNHNCFSAMNTPIVTTGYSNVTISFWWLCNGNNVTYGKIYYRTSASSTAWVQISTASTPPAALDSYNVHPSSWTLQTIHIDSLDNQAFLEFGFLFHHQGAAGVDPSFAVDDIKVVGTPGVVAPVATYTTTATTACQDSCITFTNTTTGTIDSVRWTTLPTTSVVIASPTANVTSICFHAAGTYSVTLTAHNSGGTNAVTHVITINPAPHVVITKTGHLLTATGGPFSSYQWEKNSTSITGATTSTYTYSVAATYDVIVDSGGCLTRSNIISTLGVPILNSSGNSYWVTQTDNNSINLFAAGALDEALNVTIYDATCRKILNGIWDAGSSAKQIGTGFFPQGLYIIRLSNNNTATVLKFIK